MSNHPQSNGNGTAEKIVDINSFRWTDTGREYFGIEVEPTEDIHEALKQASYEAEFGEYAVGVHYEKALTGRYVSLEEFGLKEPYEL